MSESVRDDAYLERVAKTTQEYRIFAYAPSARRRRVLAFWGSYSQECKTRLRTIKGKLPERLTAGMTIVVRPATRDPLNNRARWSRVKDDDVTATYNALSAAEGHPTHNSRRPERMSQSTAV